MTCLCLTCNSMFAIEWIVCDCRLQFRPHLYNPDSCDDCQSGKYKFVLGGFQVLGGGIEEILVNLILASWIW